MMSRWERLRRRLVRILNLELRRPVAAFAISMALAGCIGPASSPRTKLEDAVQETNLAVRFGRMDIAMGHVSAKGKDGFIKRHKLWGNEVRIVDLEFSGVEKIETLEAVLFVTFTWYRPNEGLMRQTKVKQTWKNEGGGPWFLADEERADGDIGLLGEPPVTVLKPAKEKAQFETTVIR